MCKERHYCVQAIINATDKLNRLPRLTGWKSIYKQVSKFYVNNGNYKDMRL